MPSKGPTKPGGKRSAETSKIKAPLSRAADEGGPGAVQPSDVAPETWTFEIVRSEGIWRPSPHDTMPAKTRDGEAGPEPGIEVAGVLAVARQLLGDLRIPEPNTALLLYTLLQLPGTIGHRFLGTLPDQLRAQLTLESLQQASLGGNGISFEHINYAAGRIARDICGDSAIDSRHLLLTCLIGSGFLGSSPELRIPDTATKFILGRSNMAVRAMRYAGVNPEAFLEAIRAAPSKSAQGDGQQSFPSFILLWRQRDRIRAFRLEDLGEFVHQPLSPKVASFPATLGLPEHSLIKSNDSILELEELLNNSKAAELEYQRFFEKHPEFLMTDEHVAVRPGVTLTAGDRYGLRPDFFLQRRDVPFWDIAELKLPTAKLVQGRPARRGWAAAVHSAVDQLREYRRFFEDPALARQIRERHGLEVYYPRLTLIVGRDAAFGSYKERQRLVPPEARILTYDDLLRLAKHRSIILPLLRRHI
jgi:hypothetical protein